MKNLISKKLALLAMVLFASIGSAFGFNINFEFNYQDVAEVSVYVNDTEGDGWFSLEQNTEWTFSETAYSVELSGVSVYNSIYSFSKIFVDGDDVTVGYINNGNRYFFADKKDHTVRIELNKMATKTFNVTISHPDALRLNFSNNGFWTNTAQSKNVEVPEGNYLSLYFDYLSLAYSIQSIKLDGTDITEEFINNYGRYFESVTTDHTLDIVLEELPYNTVYVNFIGDRTASVRFEDGRKTMWSQDANILATGHNVKMFIDPIMGKKLKTVVIKDTQNHSTDITETFAAQGYYEFSNLNADYTVEIELQETKTHNVHVSVLPEGMGEANMLSYVLDPEYGTGWTIDTENGNVFNEGMNVRIEANPYDYSKEVVAFVVDGEDMITEFRANGYVEFLNLSDDHNVYISFADKPTVTVNYDESGGSVELSDLGTVGSGASYSYASGTKVIITPYPNYGYSVSSITVNGNPVTLTDGSYEWSSIWSNIIVNVTFEEMPSVEVNYNDELGGVTCTIGDTNYWVYSSSPLYESLGTVMRLIPYAYDGYMIESVTVNGTPVTLTNGYYEFTFNESVTVEVNFVDAEYCNFSVTCDSEKGYYWFTSNCVVKGSNTTFGIEPNDGYVPVVKVDNAVVPTDQLTFYPNCYNGSYQYKFTNVVADHEVEVTFTLVGVSMVTFEYNGSQVDLVEVNHCMKPSPGSYVDNITTGTNAMLKVIPKIGCEVVRVVANNTDITNTLNEEGFYRFVVAEGTISITTKKKTAPTNVTFTLPTSGEGTYCSEYDLNFRNVSGIKAYIASGFDPTNSQLVLTRVDEAPAGTGMLIKGTSGEYTIPTTDSNFLFANMLKGVVKETYISDVSWYEGWNGCGQYANYILGTDGEFYKTTGEELPANSAYLMIPSAVVENSALAKISTLFLDDEEDISGIATGVGFIMAGEPKTITTNDDVYNLQGQKVNSKTLKPGIYIKNGKKFMVK